MIKGKATYFVLGIVIISALFLRIFSKQDNWICVNGSWEKRGNPTEVKPSSSCSGLELIDQQNFILEGSKPTTTIENIATTTILDNEKKMAVLIEPKVGSVVSSPLVVKGEAPGYWFFEASLPIKLLDAEGKLITTSPASAEADALTDNFVPFKSLLEFNTTATSGFIVITNDNPSGLPENELSVKIPVLFFNK